MKEEFLHYIWKYKLYQKTSLKIDDSNNVQVINSGTHNFNSGPDFFNAKIRMGETIWAGNIEIHINSSDWYVHNHHMDKAYDNVILQVVLINDKDVFRSNGQKIPTIELKFDQKLYSKFESLIKSELWVSCEKEISEVDSFGLTNWLEKLSIERLEEKSDRIKKLLKQTNNNWELAFYYQLAGNFGFNLNSEPFEMLAKSLSLNILAKHKNNLFQIEALLFGQAGFLKEAIGDDYYLNLRKEYIYLAKKFELEPMESHLWKFLRSRPGNFPTVRMAQFSALIFKSKALFSKITETKTLSDFYSLFSVNPSKYWETHYLFNKESVNKIKSLGKSAIDVLLINTVIPFLFVYGKLKGISEMQEFSLSLLEKMRSESNTVIDTWIKLGIKPANAFESQALIQLKNRYCNPKKCLNCHIGNLIIKQI